jgi:hypothetical protein
MAEKWKVIFQLDSGASFSVLPFSLGPWSNDKSYHLGQIWPAPRGLVYPASGLLLGRPPLLSLFLHSSWNSSASAGMGFTIATKSSNSPPSKQLFLLSPHSGTNRYHSVDRWDYHRVSQDALPIQIKLKNPSQFPHQKQYPLKPGGWWGLMPIINLKFLWTLILKYKLQSKQLERIYIGIEYIFWEVKGKSNGFWMRKDFVEKGFS